MKKPKFKLLKEFKDFITKGNVVDLAVGMIIGAAFTAIVNALVNNIFKPLINSIPMKGVEGLITMLVARNASGETISLYGQAQAGVTDTVIDLSQSVYIDWGAFIMAIINFLLVALVLFAIIKVINTAKAAGEKAKLEAEKLAHKNEDEQAEAEAVAEEAPAEEPAAPAEPVETTDDLLREIRDLLKAQKKDEE